MTTAAYLKVLDSDEEAYGNAIVPHLVAEFIAASVEAVAA